MSSDPLVGRLLSLALLSGCLGGPHGGTAVGNPGDADAKVSRLEPELQLEVAELPVLGLRLRSCEGREVWREQALSLDGLQPSPALIAVDAGDWCALELALEGPVTIEGSTPGGSAFSVGLAVEQLAHEGPVTVDGQRLLFELPLPLQASALEALGPDAVVPPDDPLALDWAQAATASVRLWEDLDDDGLLSISDRELVAQPLDTGGPAALAESAECGCAQSSPAAGWPLLAVLWSLLLSRRQMRCGGPPKRCSRSRWSPDGTKLLACP